MLSQIYFNPAIFMFACSHRFQRVSLEIHKKSMKITSAAEKIDLMEKQRRLQSRIAQYEGECAAFNIFDDEVELEYNNLPQFDDGEEENDTEDEDDPLPEMVTIFLPSNLSHESRVTHGLEEMGRCEAMLRIGQINEALQRLRIALGEKSLLYRLKV
jgi:hypothetical protein